MCCNHFCKKSRLFWKYICYTSMNSQDCLLQESMENYKLPCVSNSDFLFWPPQKELLFSLIFLHLMYPLCITEMIKGFIYMFFTNSIGIPVFCSHSLWAIMLFSFFIHILFSRTMAFSFG